MVDVLENGFRDQWGLGGWIPVDLVAELGGADLVMEIGKDSQLGLLIVLVGEPELVGLSGDWMDVYAGREAGG